MCNLYTFPEEVESVLNMERHECQFPEDNAARNQQSAAVSYAILQLFMYQKLDAGWIVADQSITRRRTRARVGI